MPLFKTPLWGLAFYRCPWGFQVPTCHYYYVRGTRLCPKPTPFLNQIFDLWRLFSKYFCASSSLGFGFRPSLVKLSQALSLSPSFLCSCKPRQGLLRFVRVTLTRVSSTFYLLSLSSTSTLFSETYP